jgi:predicted MFS family arabinose efflux permease
MESRDNHADHTVEGVGPSSLGAGEDGYEKDHRGSQKQEDEAVLADLEPIPSGPPYSAFSKRKKQFIVFMAAFAGFFSPLTANIYFPALNTLTKELHTSSSLINLTLTTYMIFQGLAPTFFGDLADMAGRRPAYFIGFIIYIGANIGIALQDSFAALLILRCIQSTGSSSTIALGAGVVGDIATSAERGIYMGFVMMGGMVS